MNFHLLLTLVFTKSILCNKNETESGEYFSAIDEEILIRERRAVNFYRTGQKLQGQMSKTLNQLLGPHYSKRIRPNYGGPPVLVELNLSIRSIGPVDETKQDFFIDCYFRQSWTDKRLSFEASGEMKELPMNWQFLNKIWKPDTFFMNGKKSKMHKITVPNKFLRIAPDGKVSYSQRLTIHARCRMHLLKFPLDSQVCPLWIGSYGYASKDLVFQWRQPSGVSIDDLQMAQFHMANYEAGVINNQTNRLIESGYRNDSVAYLKFFFERQTGFFLLQIYTPLLVIVMCSWVSFYIVKTDAPARCCLGTTTVLSVIKIGFGGKGKPQVGYPTALDVYVIICLMSVFAALCEYAVISFLSVTMNRYKANQEKKKEAEKAKALIEQAEKVIEEIEQKKNNGVHEGLIPIIVQDVDEVHENGANNPFEEIEDNLSRKKSIETMDASTFTDDLYRPRKSLNIAEELNKIKQFFTTIFQYLSTRPNWMKMKPIEEMELYKNTEDALDDIDEYSRTYFPLFFMFMMLVYWSSYLYLINDKLEMDTF